MKRIICFLSVIFITLSLLSQNTNKRVNSIFGKVVAIIDGDTFKLLDQDSTLHRIRIANIDCPERKQPFSAKAKQFAADAIFGKLVRVEVASKDRYGRLIANVIYDDTLNLSHELVKHGFAWNYIKYSNDDDLQSMEDNAKKNKLGLWLDPNAIPPWKWRDNTRKKTKD